MAADGSPARLAPASALSDRVPPSDVEAERSVLGAMMLSADAANTVREALTRDDFYRPAHASIFDAATELFIGGDPIDPITLSDQLAQMGLLDQVGGRAYVHGLVDTVPSAANVGQYSEIVSRMSVLRQLIRAADEIRALGLAPSDDVEQSLGTATEVLYDVVQRRIRGGFEHIGSLVGRAYEELEHASELKDHIIGVPTGFVDLDDILAGLKKGELLILAARPSIGKTTLALNIAAHAGRSGIPSAIFSLEMSAEQLAQRMLCAEARVDVRDIYKGRLADDGWAKLADAAGRLADMHVHVDATPALNIVELRTKARRLFAGHSNGLVIVDYLQLMQPSSRVENRQQEIAEISRGLKMMAKELDVPVLALSQLNRAVELRQTKRPQLSDLRESGSLEQDSDVVMLLHRDIYGPDSDDDADDRDAKMRHLDVIVAKNRNGPIGELRLTFFPGFTRFENYAGDDWNR